MNRHIITPEQRAIGHQGRRVRSEADKMRRERVRSEADKMRREGELLLLEKLRAELESQ
jgi:hypothetical protein